MCFRYDLPRAHLLLGIGTDDVSVRETRDGSGERGTASAPSWTIACDRTAQRRRFAKFKCCGDSRVRASSGPRQGRDLSAVRGKDNALKGGPPAHLERFSREWEKGCWLRGSGQGEYIAGVSGDWSRFGRIHCRQESTETRTIL